MPERPRCKESERPRRRERHASDARKGSAAKRVFGPMAEAGAEVYLRPRDLPKLIGMLGCSAHIRGRSPISAGSSFSRI